MPKYTLCYECGNRLDIADSAMEFDGNIYCDRDCVMAEIEWRMCDIEVEDCHCDEEDAEENYKD